MVEFCPECSNLLRKKTENGKIFLACKCGFQKPTKTSANTQSIHKKKKALERNLVIISKDDKISVHPKVKRICPKCGHKEAETWQKQMRSADEPSTHFFRCVKCRHTWREG